MCDMIDAFGNCDIQDLSLKAAVQEANERIGVLKSIGALVELNTEYAREHENQLIDLLGSPYLVKEFFYVSRDQLGTERASVILIDYYTGSLVTLKVETYFEKGRSTTFAHKHLKLLRKLCEEHDIKTPSELQFELEVAYHGLNQ